MKNIKKRLQAILIELNFIIIEIQDYNHDIKKISVNNEAKININLLLEFSKDLYHVCKTAKNIVIIILKLQNT